MNPPELFFPKEEFRASFEEKGSTFLSFLMPHAYFVERLNALRAEHPKAVHFVSASRQFNEFGQIEESFSDDGEPKGTSGMPTLKVLRGYHLIDTALITVRYFGGTLLGTGGLVRAYTQSAKNVILGATLHLYKPCISKSLYLEYSHLQRAEYWALKLELELVKEEFLPLGVKCQMRGERQKVEAFLEVFKELFEKRSSLEA